MNSINELKQYEISVVFGGINYAMVGGQFGEFIGLLLSMFAAMYIVDKDNVYGGLGKTVYSAMILFVGPYVGERLFTVIGYNYGKAISEKHAKQAVEKPQ